MVDSHSTAMHKQSLVLMIANNETVNASIKNFKTELRDRKKRLQRMLSLNPTQSYSLSSVTDWLGYDISRIMTSPSAINGP